MADTRQQIYELIDRSITDPYQRQNTAAVVRAVLKYIVQNAANLADDDLAGVLFWEVLQKSSTDTQTIQQAIDAAVAALLHYRGKYVSLAALQAAIPAANEGDYAHVDAGAGADVEEYIWDSSDGAWVKQTGTSGITESRVLELLGDYLPLVNPDGATVEWGTPDAEGNLPAYLQLAQCGWEAGRWGDNGGAQQYGSTAGSTLIHWLNQATPGATAGSVASREAGGINRYASFVAVATDTEAFVRLLVYEYDTVASTYLNTAYYDFKPDGIYKDGQPYGGGGTPAPTLGTGALAVSSGAMTVPMDKDGVYYAASYPTAITVDTTGNSLGRGVVCKVVANGTTAPTVAGATKHNSSANFNTTNGTSNTLRVWCEYNASNVKTNYYIWTQQ